MYAEPLQELKKGSKMFVYSLGSRLPTVARYKCDKNTSWLWYFLHERQPSMLPLSESGLCASPRPHLRLADVPLVPVSWPWKARIHSRFTSKAADLHLKWPSGKIASEGGAAKESSTGTPPLPSVFFCFSALGVAERILRAKRPGFSSNYPE